MIIKRILSILLCTFYHNFCFLSNVQSEPNQLGKDRISTLINLCREKVNSDLESAKYYADQLLIASELENNSAGLYEANMILCSICFKKEDFECSVHHSKVAISYATLIDDKAKLAKCYNNIGIAYIKTNQNNLALEYLNKTLVLKKQIDDQLSLAYTLNNLGILYMNIGNFDKSLDYFLQSLTLKRQCDSTINTSSTLGNISSIYTETEDYNKAIDYLNQALIEHEKAPNRSESVQTLINLGFAYKQKEEFSKAIDYYDSALKIANKHHLVNSIARIKMFTGSVFFAQKHYYDATQLYSEALLIYDSINDKAGLVDVYYNLSRVSFEKNKLNQSLSYIKKSNDIAHQIGAKTDLLYNYQHLSNLNYKLGEYENALIHYKTYVTYKDSIYSDKSNQTIERLKIEFETKEKEQKILILSRNQQLKEAQISKQNLFILILAITALLLISIVFFVVMRIKYVKRTTLELQQQQQKIHQLEMKQLSSELDMKNKELTTNIMHLIEKNAVIQKTTQDLIVIKPRLQKQYQQDLTAIISELRLNANQGLWEEFEKRFGEVHQNFYVKLASRFPDLTPNELKLCAFLKLNMNTKDIAAITLKTVHSINVARTRLRKKLGISNTETNTINFLTQID